MLWSALARTIQPLSGMQGVHISGVCFDLINLPRSWFLDGSGDFPTVTLPVADHSPLQLSNSLAQSCHVWITENHVGTKDFMPATAPMYRPNSCADNRPIHVNLLVIKVADILCGTALSSLLSQPGCAREQAEPSSYERTCRCLLAIFPSAAVLTNWLASVTSWITTKATSTIAVISGRRLGIERHAART